MLSTSTEPKENVMIYHSHAIEQFITRYDRTLNHREARTLLENATHYKAEKTLTGDRYYDVPDLGMRLITKFFQGGEHHGREVCITIVKAHRGPQLTDLEVELIEAAAARASPMPLPVWLLRKLSMQWGPDEQPRKRGRRRRRCEHKRAA
jgi:hypothetical protein